MNYEQPNNTTLLSSAQAARRLGLQPKSLIVLRHRGTIQIPYYRIGRRVMYAEQDINAYLAAHRVEPARI